MDLITKYAIVGFVIGNLLIFLSPRTDSDYIRVVGINIVFWPIICLACLIALIKTPT